MAYHINPTTHRVNKCTAKKRCRFTTEEGEVPPHFSTKEEAEAHLTQEAEAAHGVISTLKKKPRSVPLAEEEAVPPKQENSSVVMIKDHLSALPRFPTDPQEREVALQRFQKAPSPLSCPVCGRYFSHQEAVFLISDLAASCHHRHEDSRRKTATSVDAPPDVYRLSKVDLEPREDFSDIVLDQERIKDRHWLHATERGEHWYENLKKAQERFLAGGPPSDETLSFLVHAGAPEAAVERVLMDYNPHLVRGDKAKEEKEVYFFDLALKKDTAVQEGILEDDDAQGGEEPQEAQEAMVYLNRWEGVGTLSVAAPLDAWEVVGMHKVKIKDLWDYQLLYNLPEAPEGTWVSPEEEGKKPC